MTECIFCAIAAARAPCHKIWEDDKHLAFLSIFPNTEGFSVVITKAHHPSYAFDLPDDVLAAWSSRQSVWVSCWIASSTTSAGPA